ncbi:fam-c protein [Plasmodium chabaudi chabaudi]|uniref:Fam-c protein n=1 Tax=Plasmodium chabaudi chabaudi TaxID=31271 RepID=A0A1D3L932_PLACU|nr:fam-c protein [Plasmodium chabaudi chabaudi]SCL88573.1 fam-c protein [Plasmodium chabaudi chabaudi]VTZ68184.1 fam-c protein [Plasmodium chabaudi chabaudi]
MNKRVFSLVCIVLYAVLAVSIHCSQNKVSGAGNKNAHDTKEVNKSNKKNDIESKCETKLMNSHPKDDKYKNTTDYNGFIRTARSTGEAITMFHVKKM